MWVFVPIMPNPTRFGLPANSGDVFEEQIDGGTPPSSGSAKRAAEQNHANDQNKKVILLNALGFCTQPHVKRTGFDNPGYHAYAHPPTQLHADLIDGSTR